MSGPNERIADPDTVITGETGDRIRPARFSSDGEGITITPPGEPEPEYDDGLGDDTEMPDDLA